MRLENFIKHGYFVKSGKKESDFDEKQIEMGIKVEMEHTNSKEMAKRIALDHLTEIPDYYSRLAEMEKEAGVED